jgi:hypothetical protein
MLLPPMAARDDDKLREAQARHWISRITALFVRHPGLRRLLSGIIWA